MSKVVEFQKIRVRNFLSYGDSPIEITFDKGITFVTGYNKDDDSYNGVGKTSLIVESLSFLLFGETYRDINQKLIKNKWTNKTCIVEGWLKVNDDEIHIARGLSPNKLVLTVNGDSDKFTKTITETNKDIIERIGISKTVFTNTIVMSSKDSLSFLNQKKDLKTKFVEGILGLEAFAEFLKIAKEESKAADDKRSMKFQELNILKRNLENDRLYFDQHVRRQQDEFVRIQTKIDELKSLQPLDTTEEVDKLQEEITLCNLSVEEKQEKIKKANVKLSDLQSDRNHKKSQLDKLQGKLDRCPSCKRPYEEHNQEEIDKEKADLRSLILESDDSIKKMTSAISTVESKISSDKITIRKNSDTIKLLNVEQQKFVRSQSEIDSLINEQKRLVDNVNPFSEKIEKGESQIVIVEGELSELIDSSKIAQLIKEAASPTGIKSIVIHKVIDTLNARINYYLSRLHSPYKVCFDEFFEENFKTLQGEDYSYGSLSGGEAKRVDVAMLFAFRDIRKMQSNVDINVTVMDEILDGSICSRGMMDIVELLKENVDDCYIIVTHKKSNIDDAGCKIIDLIKENHITRLNDAY
jgi:DNA repair exonuclease SbcCD ATPase subunit